MKRLALLDLARSRRRGATAHSRSHDCVVARPPRSDGAAGVARTLSLCGWLHARGCKRGSRCRLQPPRIPGRQEPPSPSCRRGGRGPLLDARGRSANTQAHNPLTDEEESRGLRHTELFVSVARQLAAQPSRGRTAEELTRFQADRSNFRLALRRAIEIEDTDNALRLIRFLGPFWYSLRELAESYRS